jgi:hypothetical protein
MMTNRFGHTTLTQPWLNARHLVAALVGSILAFSLSAMVTSARSGKFVAERIQVPDGDDLFRVVNVDWPFDIGSETCDSDQSDYYVLLRGPMMLPGGGHHATSKSELGFVLTRANFGQGTQNSVFVVCDRCPGSKKRMPVASWTSGTPPAFVQIIHDEVNNRYGFYFNGQPIAMLISDSEALLDTPDELIIGGQVEDDSELGPWLHKRPVLKFSSGTNWEKFVPENDAEWAPHTPPDPPLFWSWYDNGEEGDGSVMVVTFGETTCSS